MTVVGISAEAALSILDAAGAAAAEIVAVSEMAGTASWTPDLLQRAWAKVRVAGKKSIS